MLRFFFLLFRKLIPLFVLIDKGSAITSQHSLMQHEYMGKKLLSGGLPFFPIITLTLSILRSTERSDAKNSFSRIYSFWTRKFCESENGSTCEVFSELVDTYKAGS
jgi:hypothetical protein